MNIININDLSHSYVFAQKEIKTLKNISLYINKGEYISIVGKNGCGKSTLVKHLNALIDIQHGEITIATLDCKNNKNIYKIRYRHISHKSIFNSKISMSFIKEILTFIVNEKKWWLAPLIFILLIVSLLVIFADSAVAPFIYSLF